MGGGKRSTSAAAPPQHMYFLEGGLLVVGNLLKTDVWVHDEVRTHCSVCMQQFLPFRRRHHCRTCGEVVCGGCSSKREICLTDVNVQCATRVCTFCMIRATDASIKLNETAVRETLAMDKRRMTMQYALPPSSSAAGAAAAPSPPPPAGAAPRQFGAGSYASYATQSSEPTSAAAAAESGAGGRHGDVRSKQLSMWSMDSELTNGSVVQLWPPPIPDDESARLQIVRNSVILRSENDPTMNLLVSIVARTLECPVAFIGILDDRVLWFKASVGWDQTHIPRDDCVCAHALAQSKTVIVGDTNADKRFHANNISIGARPMWYYAAAPIRVRSQCIGVVGARDSAPHRDTSAAMRSTLEAVANIVSEVLEQRVDGSASRMTNSTFVSVDRLTASTRKASAHSRAAAVPPQQPSETASDSSSERSSSTGTDDCGGLLDLHASLRGLNLADYASSQGSSDDLDWTDPSPCMYLALSSVPPEYGDKIGVSMDLFQRLQSTLWTERPPQDGVKAFELFRGGRQLTRSNTKLSGTCAEAVAHLQNYDNARIYANLFSHVTRRYKLSAQTWMDEITFQPDVVLSGREAALRVLTHSRQYPDGSTVVVAVNATKMYEAEETDLLFGWFVAPCSLHDGLGSVNVSCIVTQPFENQVVLEPNLSCDLLLRLRACLPQPQHLSSLAGGFPPSVHSRARPRSVYAPSEGSNQRLSYQDLMPPVAASSPEPPAHTSARSPSNQRAHETSASRLGITRTISEESFGSFGSDRGACAKIVPVRPRALAPASSLNDNERMMLELLDKTISTQEILAAQQSEMASVIDYHGSQLQRISTAIERVETLLADSGERLKRLPQPKDRRSVC